MRFTTLLCAALLSACAKTPRPTQPAAPQATALAQLSQRAQAWLASLDADQRALAVAPIDSEERRRWSYLPGERGGLRLSQMRAEQREQALALAKQALSLEGARQVEGVRALESMLHELTPGSYDEQWYDLLVLGDPAQAPWALRLEGHHLSYLLANDGNTLSVTPFFLGVTPFTVRGGALDSYEPLLCERDRAFALQSALSAEEREQARSSSEAPSDVLGTPGSAYDRLRTQPGLALASMHPAARRCFWDLVECYTQRLSGPFASAQLDRIRQVPPEQLLWTWAGSETPDQRHYYCIRGPFFAIEFDSAADSKHVHTVWHDFERNHGDALMEHKRSSPHAAR